MVMLSLIGCSVVIIDSNKNVHCNKDVVSDTSDNDLLCDLQKEKE